jgi:hypothetical protein
MDNNFYAIKKIREYAVKIIKDASNKDIRILIKNYIFRINFVAIGLSTKI